jgi:hypothetical protein
MIATAISLISSSRIRVAILREPKILALAEFLCNKNLTESWISHNGIRYETVIATKPGFFKNPFLDA